MYRPLTSEDTWPAGAATVNTNKEPSLGQSGLFDLVYTLVGVYSAFVALAVQLSVHLSAAVSWLLLSSMLTASVPVCQLCSHKAFAICCIGSTVGADVATVKKPACCAVQQYDGSYTGLEKAHTVMA